MRIAILRKSYGRGTGPDAIILSTSRVNPRSDMD
jgi:hypothetical protein